MTEPLISTVVRRDEAEWRALPAPGVSMKVLREDKDTGEWTAVFRFVAGARFPARDHPGGEQVFVLEGDLQIGGNRLKAGDYLYTPPPGKHAVSTEGGWLLLATALKPTEILKA